MGATIRVLMRTAAAALLAALTLAAAAAARAATEVRIEGDDTLAERVLREAAREELAALEDPGRRGAAAADAAFQMESAGRRAGYAFIEVGYAITGEGDAAAVVFTVREGTRVQLGEIAFSGNASFPAAELGLLVAAGGPRPYVAADVGAGRRALVQFYRDAGYRDVAVGDPSIVFSAERTRADVRYEIVEGIRYLIAGVVFDGDGLPDPGAGLQPLAAGLLGKPYFPRRTLALAGAVEDAFAAQGYPEAQVTVREETGAAPGDVVLRVTAAGGPRVRIGRVDIAGNARTREKVVRSRMPVSAGDWFDEEKIHEGFRELYRTGLFSRVEHALEGEGAERTLVVRVEEAPAREVSGEIGWGSYERLRGKVGFRDRNVFGIGHTAGVEAGASTKSRFVKTGYLDPAFLGSKLSLGVPFSWSWREEPSYTEEVLEVNVRLYRLRPGRVMTGIQYGFSLDHVSQLSPDVPADARDEEHTSASVKANVEIDRRDNIFYPDRGWQASLSLEVADQRLGGSQDYARATAGAKLFQPLGAGFVFGARFDTGFIVPTRGSEDIPVNDRFFTGGEHSVRSFEEQQLGPKGPTGDPIGGLASTVASVEVRRRISGNLAASIFADIGNVAPNESLRDFSEEPKATADYVDSMWKDYFKDFRAGVGLGLQYLTPVGPIRLDAAWNPAPRESQGEEPFVYHFSIGMAF